ncbi:hypothetical protein H257_07957 [Aphanomyces astaci]|uniref:DUF7769 domain-containing protein n=1 Tax=Aphanomyces astaci TaxID=112090 RepID=W4GHG6_APHAT|nr:hypothetical protein H257_07957 [Aphanomyces astaci]ETV78408.1 hypothetical protein H257_07957 [Aphanomyces astaci]|eukprot:XP_009831989.1 hypothetical protein H257_07957 [Aphanomyces astaci]
MHPYPTNVRCVEPRPVDAPRSSSTHLRSDERQALYETLLGVSSQGVLPRGSIVRVSAQFGCHALTVSRIWSRGLQSVQEGCMCADVASRIRGNSGPKRKRTNEEIEAAIHQVPQASRQTLRSMAFKSKQYTQVDDYETHERSGEFEGAIKLCQALSYSK